MSKGLGCAAALIAGLLVIVGIGFLWGTGLYNGLVGSEQEVVAQWAQVENVYQRRADLVPNLVNTVRGAANFERGTLTDVIEARSKVGQMNITPQILEDPGKFAQFQQAQDQLGSALSRLMVVVERYPELRSVAAFQDLMTQLEGTENRIAVERMRFNEVARGYNTQIRRFPANVFISMLGWNFKEKAYFQAQEGAERAPEVNFGDQ